MILGAERMQMSLEQHLMVTENNEVLLKMVIREKDIAVNLKELPMAKAGTALKQNIDK